MKGLLGRADAAAMRGLKPLTVIVSHYEPAFMPADTGNTRTILLHEFSREYFVAQSQGYYFYAFRLCTTITPAVSLLK